MQKLAHPLIGAKIKLIYTSDPYTLLCPGEAGYVVDVDDIGIVHVEWDSGSSLGLIPDIDSWQILEVADANA